MELFKIQAGISWWPLHKCWSLLFGFESGVVGIYATPIGVGPQDKQQHSTLYSQKGYEVDEISRNYIKDKGYGDYFGHGLGHGVGLEIHERPTLSPRGEEDLKENMVVTIEPGIYIPNLFGIRVEDLVVVKKDGCLNLTKLDKYIRI